MLIVTPSQKQKFIKKAAPECTGTTFPTYYTTIYYFLLILFPALDGNIINGHRTESIDNERPSGKCIYPCILHHDHRRHCHQELGRIQVINFRAHYLSTVEAVNQACRCGGYLLKLNLTVNIAVIPSFVHGKWLYLTHK